MKTTFTPYEIMYCWGHDRNEDCYTAEIELRIGVDNDGDIPEHLRSPEYLLGEEMWAQWGCSSCLLDSDRAVRYRSVTLSHDNLAELEAMVAATDADIRAHLNPV